MADERVIADRLHSAAIHLLRRVRRVDIATRLPAARLSALSVVVFGGPISLGDLAAAEQVRPPSMSRIIRELEDQGLVVRDADPSDRRAIRIRATAAGERLLMHGRNARIEQLAEWIRALDPEELSLLDDASKILARVFVVPKRDQER
jgi:DNA-binding MarR family transcriptional regulator